MPRDGKSELRLPRASPLDANHHQGAGIEERGQRSQPGLVDVLRTEISEHGVRNMALQELRGPALEVMQEPLQGIQALRRVVTSQQLGRSEEHTSELQSRLHLVCRLLLEKKKTTLQKSRAATDRFRVL